MNKKSVLWLILDAVILIVFNTIYFAAGDGDREASVWLSWFFIHAAFALVAATPFLIKKNKKPTIFGVPLYTIGTVYFLIALCVGLIFILIGGDTVKPVLVLQVILAGLYAILLLITMILGEQHAKEEAKKQDPFAVAVQKVRVMMRKTTDKKAAKALEKAYETIQKGPVGAQEAAHGIEIDMINKISELETAVSANLPDRIADAAKELAELAEERNKTLKK